MKSRNCTHHILDERKSKSQFLCIRVPTRISVLSSFPTSKPLGGEGLADADGDMLEDGDILEDGDMLELGDTEALADELGLTLGERLDEGESDELGLRLDEGLIERETDEDGLRDALGDSDDDGESDCDEEGLCDALGLIEGETDADGE